jgi:molybdate transport system substrate-binding protein
MVIAKISFAKTFAVTVARALLLSSVAVTNGAVAGAAEVKVLTSVALTSALNELAPKFEQATGNKLNIGYSLIADIRKLPT